MNDCLKLYVQEVKRRLPCGRREKCRCAKELEADVSAFLGEHPNAALEDLYDAFGCPKDIAEAYMARTDPKQVSRKRYWVIGLVIAAILVCVIGIVAVRVSNDVHDIKDGYGIEVGLFWHSRGSKIGVSPEIKRQSRRLVFC